MTAQKLAGLVAGERHYLRSVKKDFDHDGYRVGYMSFAEAKQQSDERCRVLASLVQPQGESL